LIIHFSSQIIISARGGINFERITVGTDETGLGAITAKEKFITGRTVGIDAHIYGLGDFGTRLKISVNRNTDTAWHGNRGGVGKSVLGIGNEEKDTNKSGED
jgi:hypothetical protein